MSPHQIETHTAGLTDLPVVRRLVEHAITLDNETAYTTDDRTSLGSLLLPSRGQVTLIARAASTPVVGQLRMRYDDINAHITYLAPAPVQDGDTTLWLHALDGMAREAGRMRAHNLIAEVAEDSPLFEILRRAGFAVYARQQVWHRSGMYSAMPTRFRLHEENQYDLMGVQALMGACVPRLVMPYAMPHGDMPRLVYTDNGTVKAYIAYSTGRRGVYILGYLHHDVMQDASHILDAALQMIAPPPRCPIAFCVRRYQDWLATPMERLGFTAGVQQALMVKHIAAGVRPTQFEALAEKLDRVRAKTSSSHNSHHHQAF